MECSSCAERNPADAAFCGGCGVSLAVVATGGAPPPGVRADRRVPAGHRSNGRATRRVQAGHDRRSRSATTRYLCAAVQLDSGLATRVIDEVLEEDLKAPPSSPDVDLGPVIRHALAARSRQLVRDVLLTVLLLVALWALLTSRGTALLLVLLLAWAVLSGEQVIATYGVVARDLRPETFDPDSAPDPADVRMRQRLSDLAVAAEGNVTVYDGFVPFVGCGEPVSAWSFALDVRRPAEGRTCESFGGPEVHAAVLRDLGHLDVPGLHVEERVFIDGADIRGDTRFLPEVLAPPLTAVPSDLLRGLVEHPEDSARPYICAQVVGWKGQLVLSTFVRLVATTQHLFVEVSSSLLAPVRVEYQEVDRLQTRPAPQQLARIVRRSLLRTPARLLLAPRTLSGALWAPVTRNRRQAQQRRQVTQTSSFRYGASSSPREWVADKNYQRYFQRLDRDMHEKVVERTVLSAVVDFLDAKGIDTGELVQRQTTILNNGVFVTGGATVTTQSMAAGAGAQASTGLPRLMEAARAAAPGAQR
jgi:hypothetical protein